ncbi:hypothetical protein [Streptomyces sp. NBC_00459]|uniref:hypothetical protein n=1 Tax=Streptomyces sp. NBC_00459 TaxID=2975749 RepID=UPI002E19494B
MTQMYSDPRDGRRVVTHDDGTDAPLPPAWRLAGEDDENDSDHPHICRGID